MSKTARPRSLVIVLILALATLIVPAATSLPQANASTCKSTDKFSGSVATIQHYLHCNRIPFNVYTMPVGTTATVTPALPSVRRVTSPTDGPPCQWQTKHIVEICYQRGIGHLFCAQWWHGDYYAYHCGPVEAYNISHAESLWDVVRKAFTSHAAKACVKGTVAGTVTAVILKSAGAATGIGIAASLAGGCVGGLINFWWKWSFSHA